MMPPLGMPGFPFGAQGLGGEHGSGMSDFDKGKSRRFSETDQVSMPADGRGSHGPPRNEPAAIKGVDDDANSDALSAASGSEAGDIEDINADDI